MISQMNVGVEARLAYNCNASSRLVFPTLFLPTRRLTRPRCSIFRSWNARKLRISSEFRMRVSIVSFSSSVGVDEVRSNRSSLVTSWPSHKGLVSLIEAGSVLLLVSCCYCIRFGLALQAFQDLCIVTYRSLIFTGVLENPHTVAYRSWV